jgi:hypothetical protein
MKYFKKDYFNVLSGLLIFFSLIAMLEGNFSFWKALTNIKQPFFAMTFVVSIISGILILLNSEE